MEIRAKWMKWMNEVEAELWQAVALSLDIEPKRLPGMNYHPIVGEPWDDCPEDFKERLEVAANRISELIEPGDGVEWQKQRTRVRLVKLRSWASALPAPWSFPNEFPVNKGTAEPAKAIRKTESAPLPDSWVEMARAKAREFIKTQAERDLYPSQNTIADAVAREFRAVGVVGREGKPLSGATIKRHALQGISSAKPIIPKRGK